MANLEKDCLKFMISLAKQLSREYEEQYQSMEEFARWNLPEETGLEWIDAQPIIEILENSNYLPDPMICNLKTICQNFYKAFDKTGADVWSHESMKTSDFWKKQRILAKLFIDQADEYTNEFNS